MENRLNKNIYKIQLLKKYNIYIYIYYILIMSLVYCVGICFLIIIGAITAKFVEKYYEMKEKKKKDRLEKIRQKELDDIIKQEQALIEKENKDEVKNIEVCKDFKNWADVHYDTCKFYGETGYNKRCSKGDINSTYVVSADKIADQTFSNFDENAPLKGKYKGIPAYAACCECGGGIGGPNFEKWCETNISEYCPEKDLSGEAQSLSDPIISTEEPVIIEEKPEEIIIAPFTEPPQEPVPEPDPADMASINEQEMKEAEDREAKNDASIYSEIVNKKINGSSDIGTPFMSFDEAENICTNDNDCIGILQHKYDGNYTPLKKSNFLDADMVEDTDNIFFKKGAAGSGAKSTGSGSSGKNIGGGEDKES